MTRDEPNAPLRADIRLLGDLLGEVLRGNRPETFARVEQVRRLAKLTRRGDDRAAAELQALLAGLDAGETLPLARAFAHFLALSNVAEQHHRTRRRLDYQRGQGSAAQRGSLTEGLERLRELGVPADALHELVCGLDVELVLTAHPTEVHRRTLLRLHDRIATLLARRDRPDLTTGQLGAIDEELRRVIATICGTDELQRERPTPLQEANAGLLVFEQSLWDAVPRFARELDAALRAHTGAGLPLETLPIRFGSWMGGDRDGNPHVTAPVTARVLALARWLAADLYWHELDALRAELPLRTASAEILERVGEHAEPYRALLEQLRDRMDRTRRWAEALVHERPAPPLDPYLDPDELRAPLLAIWRSLHETGAGAVAQGRLLDILRRLSCFGLTLVRLDLRQDAARHTAALDEVTRALGYGGYAGWGEELRQAFVVRELVDRRPLVPGEPAPSAETAEILDTVDLIRREQGRGLGAYVISMAGPPSDVLAVELLQKDAGAGAALPVVPLFETLESLQRAGERVGQLLDNAWFRDRVARRGDQLELMIGYSDSAKDAGLMMASWALYRAQEEIAAVCRRHGVRPTFFHGRGGSVGRGGGPAHLAILSLPPDTLTGPMRVTEQGEVIQAKFGLQDIALRNMELYVTAMAEAIARPHPPAGPTWRRLMEAMAGESMQVYRGMVRDDPRFVRYFRTITPEPELAMLNIGSRPARRRAGSGVDSLRAIPWVFAWTQTRLMLPSWLGVGTALRSALDGPDRSTLQEMARRWTYFRTFLSMVEMVLAKADPGIHALYVHRLGDEELAGLWGRIESLFDGTRAALLEVLGQQELLESNPVLKRAIEVRNPYVDPLNVLQVELLSRLRQGETPALRDALSITINGIASGMRNTG